MAATKKSAGTPIASRLVRAGDLITPKDSSGKLVVGQKALVQRVEVVVTLANGAQNTFGSDEEIEWHEPEDVQELTLPENVIAGREKQLHTETSE